MTSDQERTIEALSLHHGGWAIAEQMDEWSEDPFTGCFIVQTAGDQPDYTVFPDGDAHGSQSSGECFRLTMEEVQLAVYGQEVC